MNYSLTLLCLLLAVIVREGWCCTKKNPKLTGNVWQRLVGQDIQTAPYSSSGDNPVDTCDKLNCDSASSCCWSNAGSNSGLDWVTVSGPTEPKKMQGTFGTQTSPSGNALGVGSETRPTDGKNRESQLYSCPITCTQGQISVSMMHWQSKNVILKVCTETDPSGPLQNCQQLSQTSGQSDTVNLPGGPNVRVVIVADGFVERKGSVAMVQNIQVQCQPCITTTTTIATTTIRTTTQQATTQAAPPVTTVAPAVCKAITCDFESGNTCAYSNAQNTGDKQQWSVVQPPWQNKLTGLPVASHGSKVAGCYLNPGESATLSTDVKFPSDYIVQFYSYLATDKIQLVACCGDLNHCLYSTTPVQSSDYRSWHAVKFTCPAGTSKVLFHCENKGNNQGACGLDNIQVLSTVDKSAQC